MAEQSGFQFDNFFIKRAVIDINDDIKNRPELSIKFSPSGIINRNDKVFQLHLDIEIKDEGGFINIEVSSFANFHFEDNLEQDTLDNFFYINASALIFPYIRAYISALTTLSGMNPITLPTMNLTSLSEDLKNNTKDLAELT